MTPRVLITGGAGFIGSHLVERCVGEGWSVEVIDDLSTGRRSELPEGVPLHVEDVGGPAARRVIRDGSFDVVFHLAAQMDVRRSVADPVADTMTNVLGTVAVLHAVSEAPRPPRFVFASTGGVIYGDHNRPPNRESFRCEPDSPYAVAKLAGEHYAACLARVHGLETLALRLANVYGPRQDPHGEAGVVAIFCGRLLAGEPLTVFGDGRQTRDYVYVADVCDAFIRAAAAPPPPADTVASRAFNIGTGAGTPVLELAAMLQRCAGVEARVEFAPRRPGEQEQSFVDVRKAAEALGWRPATTLEEGVRMTWDWFAARDAGRLARA